MSHFHAGRVFEPQGLGKTRVKTYADGGAVLSDEIMSDEEAIQLIPRPCDYPEREITDGHDAIALSESWISSE